METMHKLKDMLWSELDEIVDKGELNATTLDMVDKLTHSIKSICSIEEKEGGYSGDYHFRENSYARRRRDSRGRYMASRANDRRGMIDSLEEMMDNAPNENIRMRARELLKEFEKA